MSLDRAERDLSRLRDMLEHAEIAMSHVAGMDEAAFRASRLHQDAVIRVLAIIGEAANNVSPVMQAAHAELPWRLVIGMRHRLVHDYGGVAIATVWATLHDQLPDLVKSLRALLPPQP